MFRFASVEYFWLLTLIPIFIVSFILYDRHKRRQLAQFGDEELVALLMPNASRTKPIIKFALLLLAYTLLVFALARPQFGTKEQTVKRQGIEVMFALDISNSMLAEDVAPNRLERAKQVLVKLIDKMNDDKVGLIVFAGEAYTQLPITADYVSAKMFLETITPELITKQGTDLGAALTLANRSFTTQPEVGRTIILITDGENHEGGVEQAIKTLTDKNIQINVLGIGSPEGSPIPMTDSRDFRRDKEGNIVVTKLNEAMCQELAKAGNGVYVRVDNTNTAQRAIQQAIDKLAKADIETQVYSDYNEQFQAVAWLLLLFLLVELFIMERQNPLFNNIHLFEK